MLEIILHRLVKGVKKQLTLLLRVDALAQERGQGLVEYSDDTRENHRRVGAALHGSPQGAITTVVSVGLTVPAIRLLGVIFIPGGGRESPLAQRSDGGVYPLHLQFVIVGGGKPHRPFHNIEEAHSVYICKCKPADDSPAPQARVSSSTNTQSYKNKSTLRGATPIFFIP